MRQPLISCPNCGAMWGIEEMDDDYCGCCGYPDCDDDDDDLEDWEIDDDDSNDPNDSRNL